MKKNWMGDPCLPQDYTWIGLKCSMDGNMSRIISLDLSNSGLHGAISDQFSLLKSLEHLNLSNSSLNGSVPDSLTNLSSLHFLDLSRNDFRGIIPEALCTRRSLTMRYDTVNGDPCNGKSPKKKNIAIVVGIIVSVVVVLGLVCSVGMFIFCRRRPSQRKPEVCQDASSPVVHSVNKDSISEVDRQVCPPVPENREFAYHELVKITNNFSVCIGEGGFGPVYQGQLNDGTQVAVKMGSQKSVHGQGTKEFFAEVASLTKVHHRCLVLLVGYCKNKDHLALVYEYMPNGSLFDYLRGQKVAVRILSWQERSQIAHEAAQGLDYLHKGCVLPIIHRDVKSQNILLGQHMHAKISDFGLSKSFLSPAQTHISITAAAGTNGYIDPESFLGGRLSESSDVYSFGVVMLEIVTGEPPILPGLGHIVQRVKQKVAGGNIIAIVDPKLQGAYDVSSVWKVVDIAMQCTMEASGGRPAMTAVVAQLKDAVALEEARERRASNMDTSRGSAAGEMSANWGPVPR